MLNNMKKKLEMLISITLYTLYIFPFYIINFLFRIKEANLLFEVVSFFRLVTSVCLGVALWICNNERDVNVFIFAILLTSFLISVVASIIDGVTLAAFGDSKEKYEELLPTKSKHYLVDYSTKKELDITNNKDIEIFINSCKIGKRNQLKHFPEFIQMALENKQENPYQKNIKLSFLHRDTHTYDMIDTQNVCLRFLFDVSDDNTSKMLELIENQNQELVHSKRKILEELKFEFVSLYTYKGIYCRELFGVKTEEERTFIDATIKIFVSESETLQRTLKKIEATQEIETLKTKLNLIVDTETKEN